MALTATAPPAVLDEIHRVIPRPFIVRASVNQPNITYRVIKQVHDGKGKLSSGILSITWGAEHIEYRNSMSKGWTPRLVIRKSV